MQNKRIKKIVQEGNEEKLKKSGSKERRERVCDGESEREDVYFQYLKYSLCAQVNVFSLFGRNHRSNQNALII
jgi:hypothetical protein